jgi:hypothetical protein
MDMDMDMDMAPIAAQFLNQKFAESYCLLITSNGRTSGECQDCGDAFGEMPRKGAQCPSSIKSWSAGCRLQAARETSCAKTWAEVWQISHPLVTSVCYKA